MKHRRRLEHEVWRMQLGIKRISEGQAYKYIMKYCICDYITDRIWTGHAQTAEEKGFPFYIIALLHNNAKPLNALNLLRLHDCKLIQESKSSSVHHHYFWPSRHYQIMLVQRNFCLIMSQAHIFFDSSSMCSFCFSSFSFNCNSLGNLISHMLADFIAVGNDMIKTKRTLLSPLAWSTTPR